MRQESGKIFHPHPVSLYRDLAHEWFNHLRTAGLSQSFINTIQNATSSSNRHVKTVSGESFRNGVLRHRIFPSSGAILSFLQDFIDKCIVGFDGKTAGVHGLSVHERGTERLLPISKPIPPSWDQFQSSSPAIPLSHLNTSIAVQAVQRDSCVSYSG